MAYNNNFGFTLGDRASLITDFDRGQRPSKYTRLSDPSFNDEGLGRFNFDSISSVAHVASGPCNNPFVQPQQQQQPLPLQQQQQQQQQQYCNLPPSTGGGGGMAFHMRQQLPLIIPLHQADFSKLPPGFPISSPSKPLLFSPVMGSHGPCHTGIYTGSFSNDIVDPNDYEGNVILLFVNNL